MTKRVCGRRIKVTPDFLVWPTWMVVPLIKLENKGGKGCSLLSFLFETLLVVLDSSTK